MAELSAQRLAPDRRSILVSRSPHAGSRSRSTAVEQIAELVESAGYRVHATEDIDELAGLAAEWHAAGQLRTVLACGGDGTASLVRNLVPLAVPLLPVPMGTENLLGRYLSQSARPESVLQAIEEGVVVELDLGQINNAGNQSAGSPVQGDYFLLMFSAGFDAEVVRRLHDRRRGHVTRRSYVGPTLETIRSYQYPELRLYFDDVASGGVEPICCRWAFAFNLPVYACGWQIAPDAVGTDAKFDICTFERGTLLHSARYLWHVMRGNHSELSDAKRRRSKRVRIEAEEGADVAYQLDGDSGGLLPVEIDLLPGELRLLVLPDVARRLGFTVEEGNA
jgi:diacylglycerol kinase family enzyme